LLFFSSPSAALLDSLSTFDDAAAASAMVLSTKIPEMSCLLNAPS
jgi:hypothetical protein